MFAICQLCSSLDGHNCLSLELLVSACVSFLAAKGAHRAVPKPTCHGLTYAPIRHRVASFSLSYSAEQIKNHPWRLCLILETHGKKSKSRWECEKCQVLFHMKLGFKVFLAWKSFWGSWCSEALLTELNRICCSMTILADFIAIYMYQPMPAPCNLYAPTQAWKRFCWIPCGTGCVEYGSQGVKNAQDTLTFWWIDPSAS